MEGRGSFGLISIIAPIKTPLSLLVTPLTSYLLSPPTLHVNPNPYSFDDDISRDYGFLNRS